MIFRTTSFCAPGLLLLTALFAAVTVRAQLDLPAIGKYERTWLADNPYAADSSVHAYVIADERSDRAGFTDRGLQLYTTHRRVVRVLDRQAFDRATVRLQLYSPRGATRGQSVRKLRAFTHTYADGELTSVEVPADQVFSTRLDDDYTEVAFSFPNVRAGTVLDYGYDRVSEYVTQPPPAYFQEDIPVQAAEYRFTQDASFEYKATRFGQSLYTVDTEERRLTDGGTEYTTVYSARDVPAMREEPYVTSMNNYLAHVLLELNRYARPGGEVVDFATSWEDLADRLRDAPGVKLALRGNGFYEDWAGRYTGDAGDASAKTRWALNEVAGKLTWDGNYAKVANERPQRLLELGKCDYAELNAVLLGLLRALELPALPVFVSTRAHGYLHPDLPNLQRLNAMVVAIGEGDELSFVDATDPTGELGIVPYRVLNGRGLLVEEKRGQRFVPLQAKVVSQQGLTARLALGADRHLVGTVALTLRDYAAFPYTKVGSDGAVELDLKRFERFAEWEVSDVRVERGAGYSWVYTAGVRSREPALALGGGWAFDPTLVSAWRENPFQRESRNFPVEFATRLVETRDIHIALPEGMTLGEAPAALSTGSPDKSVAYRYAVAPEVAPDGAPGIHVMTSLTIKGLEHPAETYAGLRNFFDAVAGKESGLVTVVAGD